MAWSGGDYELNSEGVLWTPTTHGKLTCLCELIPPTTPRLTSFIFSFYLFTNNNNTGLQGPSLNTSNDTAPSSSPSQAWKYSGILQDHCHCLKYLNGRGRSCSPFQGYGIGYSQVRCVGGYNPIL